MKALSKKLKLKEMPPKTQEILPTLMFEACITGNFHTIILVYSRNDYHVLFCFLSVWGGLRTMKLAFVNYYLISHQTKVFVCLYPYIIAAQSSHLLTTLPHRWFTTPHHFYWLQLNVDNNVNILVRLRLISKSPQENSLFSYKTEFKSNLACQNNTTVYRN